MGNWGALTGCCVRLGAKLTCCNNKGYESFHQPSSYWKLTQNRNVAVTVLSPNRKNICNTLKIQFYPLK